MTTTVNINSALKINVTPIESGASGGVLFQKSDGKLGQSSNLHWDDTNKRLGINTSTPSYGLDVDANARLNGISIETTGLNTRTIQQNLPGNLTIANAGSNNNIQFQVNRGGTPFIPLFIDGLNGHVGVGANSASARLDIRAQGALSSDVAFRVRNSVNTRNFLVVNGAGDVFNNGAGGVTSNTFYGENVGRSASGVQNTVIGNSAAQNLSTGTRNTIIGQSCGVNVTTGGANVFMGWGAGSRNIGGSSNVIIGDAAGRFFGSGSSDLTTVNTSIIIGADSRANADNETNQIVIGNQAIGTGSNSVTLGNTSITRTNLRGQIVISGFESAPVGIEGAIYYDTVLKKHYGFNGTNWNALY